MTIQREIERSEPILAQRIGSTLQNDSFRIVKVHDLVHQRRENGHVSNIIDAVMQRNVQGVAPSPAASDIRQVARVRKEVAKLVEGHGHNAVGGEEGLFDAVAVVHVDVHVQDALVHFEQLEDGEDDVVDVAKPGRRVLLGVVESAGPVDGDVTLALVQKTSSFDRPTSRELAELVYAGKYGTVIVDVETCFCLREIQLRVLIHVPMFFFVLNTNKSTMLFFADP